MSLYKRGNVWWYKFKFEGQVIRGSARTHSKTVARDAERQRGHDLETAVNRITKRQKMPLFSVAAKDWMGSRSGLAEKTTRAYRHYVKTLMEHFGERLVCDIDARDIAALQRARLARGYSARLLNYEVGTLRQILKAHGLWGVISDQVRFLRERHDVGRAVSHDDEDRLKATVMQSRSPALLPLFVLAKDTGLRASEMRSLRRKDLALEWEGGVILQGLLTVSKSKTEAGEGRAIPLSKEACATLTLWLSRFPGRQPG